MTVRVNPVADVSRASPPIASTALLGCPFCGNIPKLRELVHDRWEIVCAGPCNLGKVTTGPYCNVHECVKAWNTRQPNVVLSGEKQPPEEA